MVVCKIIQERINRENKRLKIEQNMILRIFLLTPYYVTTDIYKYVKNIKVWLTLCLGEMRQCLEKSKLVEYEPKKKKGNVTRSILRMTDLFQVKRNSPKNVTHSISYLLIDSLYSTTIKNLSDTILCESLILTLIQLSDEHFFFL